MGLGGTHLASGPRRDRRVVSRCVVAEPPRVWRITRKRTFFLSSAAAAVVGAGLAIAQDVNKDRNPGRDDRPGIGATSGSSDLKGQCENAIRSKEYLKDCKIT